VRGRDPGAALPAPALRAPSETWPASEDISAMGLGDAMHRGAGWCGRIWRSAKMRRAGPAGRFHRRGHRPYAEARDDLGRDGTSHLSENLTCGEISARTCWWAGMRAMEEGKAGAETFLKEIVWRDFAYHLVYHTPHIVDRNWREEWDVSLERGRTPAPEVTRLEAGPHRHGRRRCRNARDVRDGPHAQPRADAGGLLPHQTPDEPLEDRARLVRGLPRGLGPGLQRHGLAVVGRLGARMRRPISGCSTPRRRPRSSTRPVATAANGWRSCPAPRPRPRSAISTRSRADWGMAAR
jgi:hypothetical protein